MATSTQNLTHSDFSLGFQVEVTSVQQESEGEDNVSDQNNTSFKEWTKHGNSDNDADEESVDCPDSTVNETVAEVNVNKEGLVPYVASDSEEATSQEAAAQVDKVTVHSEPSTSRFKSASTADDLKKLSGKTFAESTDKKIAWAVKLFMSWRRSRIEDDTAQGDIEGANLYDENVDAGQLG